MISWLTTKGSWHVNDPYRWSNYSIIAIRGEWEKEQETQINFEVVKNLWDITCMQWKLCMLTVYSFTSINGQEYGNTIGYMNMIIAFRSIPYQISVWMNSNAYRSPADAGSTATYNREQCTKITHSHTHIHVTCYMLHVTVCSGRTGNAIYHDSQRMKE